jgi:hypothetical protein
MCFLGFGCFLDLFLYPLHLERRLVSGKHILKMRKQDVVVGLVTDAHIRSENVEYDTLSLKEKEKIFTMGFIPQVYKHSLPEEEELIEGADDKMQELDVMGTAEDSGPMTIMDVSDLGLVYSTKDDCAFLQAMGELHSKMVAIQEELRLEYIGAYDNPDEDALICHLDLLSHEYDQYSALHKDKFGTPEPHRDILTVFYDEGRKNRRAIVQSVFEEITMELDTAEE